MLRAIGQESSQRCRRQGQGREFAQRLPDHTDLPLVRVVAHHRLVVDGQLAGKQEFHLVPNPRWIALARLEVVGDVKQRSDRHRTTNLFEALTLQRLGQRLAKILRTTGQREAVPAVIATIVQQQQPVVTHDDGTHSVADSRYKLLHGNDAHRVYVARRPRTFANITNAFDPIAKNRDRRLNRE